jgi:hypothetical protein
MNIILRICIAQRNIAIPGFNPEQARGAGPFLKHSYTSFEAARPLALPTYRKTFPSQH